MPTRKEKLLPGSFFPKNSIWFFFKFLAIAFIDFFKTILKISSWPVFLNHQVSNDSVLRPIFRFSEMSRFSSRRQNGNTSNLLIRTYKTKYIKSIEVSAAVNSNRGATLPELVYSVESYPFQKLNKVVIVGCVDMDRKKLNEKQVTNFNRIVEVSETGRKNHRKRVD